MDWRHLLRGKGVGKNKVVEVTRFDGVKIRITNVQELVRLQSYPYGEHNIFLQSGESVHVVIRKKRRAE